MPLVAERWLANSLLVPVDQNAPAPQSCRGIMREVGNADGLDASNTQFAAGLKRLGMPHQNEVYPGNHGNCVGARFISDVLPFFERNLDSK